jgi:hypothetical protein
MISFRVIKMTYHIVNLTCICHFGLGRFMQERQVNHSGSLQQVKIFDTKGEVQSTATNFLTQNKKYKLYGIQKKFRVKNVHSSNII